MHIHLINLDRSSDRLAEFCDLNRYLTSVSRFPGYEGSNLDLNDLVRRGLVTHDILTMFPVGAVGCAISHLALWDKAIANNQAITICEDDAIFNNEFEARAEELLKRLPDDWHIIFWGYNFDMFACFEMLPGVSPCVAVFNQAQMRQSTKSFQTQSISPQAFKVLWAFGTCCYSISAAGARHIRAKILPLHPQVIPFPEAKNVPPFSPAWRTVGFDNCINAVHREINSFIAVPPLVISKNENAVSTIQSS
jgi:GR25 family glycosyltransferase involved in LPS biosynthesis